MPSAARLLAACLDRSPAHQRLAEWLTHHAANDLTGPAPAPGLEELLPFALEGLLSLDPAPPHSAGAIDRARTITLEISRVNLARLAKLLTVVRALDARGIPSVVLKGAALAWGSYRRYGVRTMADVDLLVRPDDVAHAAAVLAELGWIAPGDPSSALLATRMRLLHARAFHVGTLHSLDLHWRLLNPTPPDVESRMWAAVELHEIESTSIRLLDPATQVFHACVHAVGPQWSSSSRWIVDVAAVLDRSGDRVDWQALVDLARQTMTTARLQTAIAELRYWLPDRIPACVPAALAAVEPADWEMRELALMTRTLPFAGRDALRWQWYQFRRLREMDRSWSRAPMLVGFVDYLRLKMNVRRRDSRGG